METVAYWTTLIKYAREQANAEKSGDEERIKEATKRHLDYKELCLSADRIILPEMRVDSNRL